MKQKPDLSRLDAYSRRVAELLLAACPRWRRHMHIEGSGSPATLRVSVPSEKGALRIKVDGGSLKCNLPPSPKIIEVRGEADEAVKNLFGLLELVKWPTGMKLL